MNNDPINLAALEQRIFLFVSAFSCACWLLITPINLSAQISLLLVCVAIFGLPHGALDPLLANQLRLTNTTARISLFIALYCLIAVLVIIVWWHFPTFGLLAFLCYGAWHFSDDWKSDLGAEARSLTALGLIAMPALFHPDETAMIFSLLTGQPMNWLTEALHVAGLIATAGIVLTAISLRQRNQPLAAELTAIVATAALLPPLLFFLVFFCFLHSLRNIRITVSKLHAPRLHLYQAAAIYTGLATTIGIVVFNALHTQLAVDTLLLRIIFIGLAALTVPHLLLHLVAALQTRLETRKTQLINTGPMDGSAPDTAK